MKDTANSKLIQIDKTISKTAETQKAFNETLSSRLNEAQMRKAHHKDEADSCFRSGDFDGYEKASSSIVADDKLIGLICEQIDNFNSTPGMTIEEQDEIAVALREAVTLAGDKAVGEMWEHITALAQIVDEYKVITDKARQLFKTMKVDICKQKGFSCDKDYCDHRIPNIVAPLFKSSLFEKMK